MSKEYEEIEVNEDEYTDEDTEAIDDFFDGISPGMTVRISRVEPSEYQGLLEVKTISSATEPIDLNYLINKWGGYKLRLKFRNSDGRWRKHVDIDLFSYEPLRLGQPIKRQQYSPHIDIEEPKREISKKEENPFMSSILPMLTVFQTMRQGDMEMLSRLIPKSEPAQQPINQIAEMLALFMKIQSFATANIQPAQTIRENESDDSQIMGLLGKAFEVFGTTQKKDNHPKIISLPERNRKSLSEQLADLPEQEILDTFQGVLGSLPDDKQERAMEMLLSALESQGIISGDDDTEENTDDSLSDTGGTS